MAKTAVVLLEQARAVRQAADRARRLANEHAGSDVFDKLTHYAEELEQRALELEQRVDELNATVATTRRLTQELRGLGEQLNPPRQGASSAGRMLSDDVDPR
jgi:hypothetical protein